MKNFVGLQYIIYWEWRKTSILASHHTWPMPDKKIEDGAKIAACDQLCYCKYALC